MRWAVKIEITKFVDEGQPGWVECSLEDAAGQKHLFIEKVPVVTLEELDAGSFYPRAGVFACEVIERMRSENRSIVRISTASPWAIESVDGQTQFEVLSDQLEEIT